MSEPSSVGPEKTVPAKKPVSPARNIIGLIVLVGVLVVRLVSSISETAASMRPWRHSKLGLQDEDKDLMTVQEAENLLGKEADGPAVDFQEGVWNFDKKTYTWRGLLKNYTLTAYYTKEKDSRLHHYETEGSKYELPSSQDAVLTGRQRKGCRRSGNERRQGRQSKDEELACPRAKTGTDPRVKTAAPSRQGAMPKPEPSDKAATPKPEPSDKAATAKPASRQCQPRRPKADPAPDRAVNRAQPPVRDWTGRISAAKHCAG